MPRHPSERGQRAEPVLFILTSLAEGPKHGPRHDRGNLSLRRSAPGARRRTGHSPNSRPEVSSSRWPAKSAVAHTG